MKCDFSGYATRNDMLCSDGVVIKKDAFKQNDKKKVPLVWQHDRMNPSNVLGHVRLENRKDGVYAYGFWNESDEANKAKELVRHGDINALSIYANNVLRKGRDVVGGDIKEVSLVLSGANPGAYIDNLSVSHSDDPGDYSEFVLYTGEEMEHSDMDEEEPEEKKDEGEKPEKPDEKTVEDVLDSMSEEQIAVVNYLLEELAKNVSSEEEPEELEDSEDTKEKEEIKQGEDMNIFEKNSDKGTTLTHSQIDEIFKDAQRIGSLKESVLQHANNYGIDGIEKLFPDAQAENNVPRIVSDDMTWVQSVIGGVRKTPFAKVRSFSADITAEEARAKGYVKGNRKKDEVFKVANRETAPTTIYKKQKLDRDDILDITSFDVVSWLKEEMRTMLEAEIARAILIGDGRQASDPDHINDECIRPIASDDELYVTKIKVTPGDKTFPVAVEEAVIDNRDKFLPSAAPTFFVARSVVSEFFKVRDKDGRRIYTSLDDVARAVGATRVVEVDKLGEKNSDDETVLGILVNLGDYVLGTNAGGDVNFFDDFDIDYNQYKYLYETRLSGALVKPKSAMVLIDGATA